VSALIPFTWISLATCRLQSDASVFSPEDFLAKPSDGYFYVHDGHDPPFLFSFHVTRAPVPVIPVSGVT